jgi:outer membrane protein OmpA-like peptidoglycan-associated protein
VYEVCVTATARGVTSQKQCSSANVVPCTPPTISIGGLPSNEVFAGERITIPVATQPGSCQSPVKVSYRAGDGVISADGTLDTTNVAFDRTNRSKLQRRSVPVTVTATDEKGATGSAQTSIIVKLAPAAQRLDDVLFASRNARVNNCGKRVLLELLTPRLRDDPEARVVLIGHIDQSENGHPAAPARKKGSRRATAPVRQLDKARVLNAAAVISGGEGICPGLELSRIKVGYAGKSKGGALRPTFCGSSTEIQATKRAGAKADARAPYRRVEVWIVPNGAEMPPGVTIQDAPEPEIKSLKCPK